MSGVTPRAELTNKSIFINSLHPTLARSSNILQKCVRVFIWSIIPSSICFNTVNIKNPITTATAIGTPTSETKVNISIT